MRRTFIPYLGALLIPVLSAHAQPDPVWWNGFEDCDEPVVLHVDVDQDGYGIDGFPMLICGEIAPGFATQAGDCNDSNANINPGEADICDGIDNNCNAVVDEDHVQLVCYEGPPGTLGVGICDSGLLMCNGGAGTSCEGQVLPVPEVPKDTQDNDCDGLIDEP